MTPYELNIYAEAYFEKQKNEHELAEKMAYMQAYLTSRWIWQKRVDIKKYLQPFEEGHKEGATDNEMLQQVKALNALMGGATKRRKRRREG